MADSSDVKITVTVDAQGAVRTLDQLGNEINSVEGRAGSAETGFTKFQATIVSLSSAVNLGQQAFSVLQGAIGKAVDVLERGSAVDDMAQSFQRLSAQAGSTSKVLLNELQKATAGTVEDFELMKSANQAMLAGMKPDVFVTLNKAARTFAEEGGEDMKQVLAELTQAFQTGQDRILKHRGIIIDTEAAETKYAASLGRTRDQLSEAGKAEATRLAILEKLNPVAARSASITDDAGDKVAQLTAAWKNSRDEMAAAIANLGAVNWALDEMITTVKMIPSAWENAVKSTRVSAGFMKDVFGPLVGIKPTDAAGSAAGEEIARALGDLIGNAADNFKSKYTPAVSNATRANDLFNNSVKNTATYITAANGALMQAIDAYKRETGDKGLFGDILDPIGSSMDSLPKADTSKVSEGLFGSIFQDEMTRQIAESTFNALNDGISKALAGELKTGKDYANAIGDIGGAAGGAAAAAFFGPEFAPIGQAAGDAIMTGIANAFTSKDTAGTKAKKALDKFFADAFDANRLAVIIDGKLTEINDLVFQGDTLFGGNVDLGSNAYFEFLRSLPAETQAAFDGVGLALTTAQGQFDDFGNNLSAALANNIGGSLQNLQLLLYSTGKSAQELNASLVTAFENGQVSALEAQTAINQVAVVLQDGIPGALGAFTEAWTNAMTAGAKGGRMTADSLSDIGDEAIEVGIHDMPQLLASLQKQLPEQAADLGRTWEILKQNGITTVEGLASATTDQLLPALAQMESEGILKVNDGLKEMGDLIDRVTKLPEEIRTKIVIDVETNDPKNGLGAVQTLSGNTGITAGR